MNTTDLAALLHDLSRAKAAFQMRAIRAVIGAPDQNPIKTCDKTDSAEAARKEE